MHSNKEELLGKEGYREYKNKSESMAYFSPQNKS